MYVETLPKSGRRKARGAWARCCRVSSVWVLGALRGRDGGDAHPAGWGAKPSTWMHGGTSGVRTLVCLELFQIYTKQMWLHCPVESECCGCRRFAFSRISSDGRWLDQPLPSPKIQPGLPCTGGAAWGQDRVFILYRSIGWCALKLQSYFRNVFQKASLWLMAKGGFPLKEGTGWAAAPREGIMREHSYLALQGCGALDRAWNRGLNWELAVIPAVLDPKRGLWWSRQNSWFWTLCKGTLYPDASSPIGLAEINHGGILDKYSSFHSGHGVNPHLRLRHMI